MKLTFFQISIEGQFFLADKNSLYKINRVFFSYIDQNIIKKINDKCIKFLKLDFVNIIWKIC